MFAAPWVCRQCARTVLARRTAFPFRRHASTVAPVLLERARRMAAEHTQLQQTLETGYDAKSAKRAGEIQGVARALAEWDAAQRSAEELRGLAAAPDEDPEMRQLARDELAATETRMDELAQRLSEALTPAHPFGPMPCLLELRPGPGGLEGRFFTDSLVKMYQAFCARRGLRARMVKYELSDGAGDATGADGESALQEAVLEVQDAGAYDLFRGEAGIHRVQRIPATEKNGRTHTSAAAVWVLPSFGSESAETASTDGEDPESDFYVEPGDVRTETMRARGAGGQHVNKTESAIRLTHVPTGTVVSMQDSRSQHTNRDNAWKILRARLAQKRREQREEDARRMRDAVLHKSQVTRADKIRTYNYSQDRVTDHRCGLDVHNLPDVLAGGETLTRVIEAVRVWQRERDVEAVLAEEEAQAKEDAAGAAKGKGKKR